MKLAFGLILIYLQFPFAAMAAQPSEMVVGYEIGFTNRTLDAAFSKQVVKTDVNNEKNTELMNKLGEEMVVLCKQKNDCVTTVTKDRYGLKAYQVTYEDGWKLDITVDVGVVELKLNKATPDFYASPEMQLRLKNDVFGLTERNHLHPNNDFHRNLDYHSAFGKDLKTLRSWLQGEVDHSEFWTGLYGTDMGNSPPLGALSKSQVDAYEKIIHEVDSGKILTKKGISKPPKERSFLQERRS